MTNNGGIWSNLTTDVLKSIQVPVPPIEYLQEIVDKILQFTSAIKEVKRREADHKIFIQNLLNFFLGKGDT